MQSLCYLDLPQLCLGTLYHPSVTMGDHAGPPHSPKPGRNATQTTTFFFVDALSGLILCYPVIRTIFNTIFFVFVLNNVKFTIKKDPHGVKWPSNNTTKVVPMSVDWSVCRSIRRSRVFLKRGNRQI